MELCRSLQGARNSRVRLPRALASSVHLPNSLTIEASQTIIGNVVREELAHSGLPTTSPVQFAKDSKIRATRQQEIATTISSVSPTQPSYTAISNDPSPSQPTCYVTVVAPMTAAVPYTQV